jgi:hypothetical protein
MPNKKRIRNVPVLRDLLLYSNLKSGLDLILHASPLLFPPHLLATPSFTGNRPCAGQSTAVRSICRAARAATGTHMIPGEDFFLVPAETGDRRVVGAVVGRCEGHRGLATVEDLSG